jgi:CheY-like chemotaxis protein
MATLKALVVDDAAFVRDLVKRTLRNQFPFIEVQEASDGRKAQGMLTRSYFDLVLCDWEMPQMSGLELLRWLRQHDAYQKTPFVMITSRGDRENVIEAIKGGVSDYLGKPFSPEALGKKIIKVMGPKLRAAAGGRSSEESPGAFQSSASLLAGASSVPSASQAEARPESEGSAVPESAADVRARNLASLRFADNSLQAVLKGITLNEARLIARRGEALPAILEPAVVDIAVTDTDTARLNGYVHQLQAVDRSQETEFVSVTIRFVDDDPQKLEDLSRFIARFQAG